MPLAANQAPSSDLRPRVAPGVIWYRDSARSLVVNTYARGKSPLREGAGAHIDLLELCDGSRSVGDIARRLGLSEAQVVRRLASWEEEAPEVFSYPGHPGAALEEKRRNAMRRLHKLSETLREARSHQDAVAYHTAGIADGFEQFDKVEPTVSHLYREPHPALGHRSYGQALADKLLTIDAIPQSARLLEVGCGTGLLARNLLQWLADEHRDLLDGIRYEMLDPSPVLGATQRTVCAGFGDRVGFISGGIEEFRGGPYDLVLSNEVIADLRVGVIEARREDRLPTEAEELAAVYDLSPIPGIPAFVVNVGAIRFLERLRNLLRPGGRALFVEYGTLRSFPKVVRLNGHNEYSIQFGHLTEVATRLGIAPSITTLGDFLSFNPSWQVLHLRGEEALREHLLPYLGIEGPYSRPFDPAYLQSLLGAHYERLGNLTFVPLGSGESYLNPFKFYVLSLRV